jgi:hypothetical protein
MRHLESYKEIWLVDFEYYASDGERPVPICVAARELRTNRCVTQWYTEFGTVPPYSVEADSLFVSYSAAAELSCHIAVGWKLPAHVLDLYVAFKMLANGLNIAPPKLPGLYDGTTFKMERFEQWLIEHEIPWPTLPCGMRGISVVGMTDT